MMCKRTLTKDLSLLIVFFLLAGLLAGCGAKPLAVRPAEPLPPPQIAVPDILLQPVACPSWMQPMPSAPTDPAQMRQVVGVFADDVRTCTVNTVKAQAAHDWAVGIAAINRQNQIADPITSDVPR